ncbi:pheromone-processing carboxypeptidase KEX1 [Coccidioides immitis RS]|uniref:Pheromone-processing carboxypeptidase KEX1 n=2 Tax=Coccidioides immitis TaxID=5501 RepID=J3K9T0_COCIM|nr:pheromone-processing carboxypeptidase KEX1 [Coccidioides immitis RS]EAS31702.3 pheromone-processing carboxypeptidase KEX1 [Coccidioides immitis RS]KMP04361.1 carboxypeptidase KEX1 [Coccidioides immitis RMSCC 2394]TPX24448.1 Cell death protease [Coccidioides immitis]
MPSTSTFTRTPAFLLHTLARWLLVWGVLGSSVVAEKKCASNYYVRSLPGQPDGPLLKMHAGHVEVDHKNNGNLFFWHFQNRHIANRQRTVIWLNGGPGCSSMDGALMEIGPYRLKDDHTLIYNEGSWDEFANILFVDQPVGTGFSYVNTNSYIHELDEMASHFVTFLEKWFELFPEYEHDDLYFAGESYAGQYIPYIAKAILDRNKNTTTQAQNRLWNLKGLLIGNGWISPVEQYQAYLTYAYKENLIQSGTDAAKRVERAHSECISELDSGGKDRIHAGACEKVLSAVLEVTRENGKCINMYDIRLRDEFPSCGMNWPPDLKHITPYLRRDDVISALHVNDDKRTGWRECTGAVSSNFNARNSKPSVQLLPEILESGIPITLFSGAKDFICNHIGTEQFIHNMQWSGGMGFELSPGVWAPRHDWTFEGEAAGYYQEARNLTYVLFYNASHMVPFDFGRRSRDMLDRFLGVDITSIGGNPADSRIDGEKGALTSVGNHPNSTTAEQREKEKLKAATWAAYYKSGEVALVVVAIAAAVWGFFIWRSRRQRQGSGYRGIYPNLNGLSSGSFSGFRNKRSSHDDIEAAADFDASELDTLRGTDDRSPGANGHCSVGGDSEDEDEKFGAQKESYHPSNMPSSSSS